MKPWIQDGVFLVSACLVFYSAGMLIWTHPPLVTMREKKRRDKRQQWEDEEQFWQNKMKRLAEARQREEVRLRQPGWCEAWDKFGSPAADFVLTMERFVQEDPPDDWQRIMQQKLEAVMRCTALLEYSDRRLVKRHLIPFTKCDRGDHPEEFYFTVLRFREWLVARNKEYNELKRTLNAK